MSRAALASFLSAAVISFFLAFSPSRYAKIGVKSQSLKSVMLVPSSCDRKPVSTTVGLWAWGDAREGAS